MRLALLFAGSLLLAAACSFHVDEYTVAPADPCAGGCVSCNAVSNQQARPSCLCGAVDGGSCATPSSQALFTTLAACALQHCPIECAALADAGTHASGSVLDCSACTETQCKDAVTACLADTAGCPR